MATIWRRKPARRFKKIKTAATRLVSLEVRQRSLTNIILTGATVNSGQWDGPTSQINRNQITKQITNLSHISLFQLTAISLRLTTLHQYSSLMFHLTFLRRLPVTTALLPSILQLTTPNRRFTVTQRHLIHHRLFHLRLTFPRRTSIPPSTRRHGLNTRRYSTMISKKCRDHHTIMWVQNLLMAMTTFPSSTIS